MPGAVDDDRLVRHRRHVGAAGGARAHHHGNLGDARGRHPRLVEEDAPEVVAVGEDLGLQRQEGAARVDQVDAGQAVLEGDLLRTQVLLHGEREVGAALDGRVVGDDQDLAAGHPPDAGDEPGAWRVAVVDVPGGQRRQFEERRPRIQQAVQPFPDRQLALRAVPGLRFVAAALRAPAPAAPAARRRAPPSGWRCGGRRRCSDRRMSRGGPSFTSRSSRSCNRTPDSATRHASGTSRPHTCRRSSAGRPAAAPGLGRGHAAAAPADARDPEACAGL